MSTWTNKHWGALFGVLLVVTIAWLGLGTAALVAIFGVVGYFIGKFLDGEFDIEDIRRRAQGGGGGQQQSSSLRQERPFENTRA